MRRSVYWPHLYVVKEDGEPALRMWALSFLIEDRTDGLPSYVEYLDTVKSKVSHTISADDMPYSNVLLMLTLALLGQFGIIQLDKKWTAVKRRLGSDV